MKRVAAGILCLAGLWAGSACALEPYQEESEKSYPAAGISSVYLENARGRVELSGTDGDAVVVRAIKTARGHGRADARELAAATQVALAQEGSRLVVRVRYPQITDRWCFWSFNWSDHTRRGVKVRLLVQLPPRVEAEARVASGDIISRGVSGRQALTATSGDIRVEDAGGPVELHSTSGDLFGRGLAADAMLQSVSGDVRATSIAGRAEGRSTSGDIRVADVAGALTLSSVSGDVGVRGARGGLKVGTTSGDVVARDVTGPCVASVSSGDVDVEFTGTVGESEISSASGDVTVRLSPQARCNLELRTGSGTIEMRVPLRVKSVSRHLVSGTVGGGGASVRVRTSSGEVLVAASEGGRP